MTQCTRTCVNARSYSLTSAPPNVPQTAQQRSEFANAAVRVRTKSLRVAARSALAPLLFVTVDDISDLGPLRCLPPRQDMVDFLFEGEADTIQRLVNEQASQESCAAPSSLLSFSVATAALPPA